MLYKRIKINVFCSKTPCLLTILSCDGKIIKKIKTKTKNTKICICTKERCVKLMAKYGNQIVFHKICVKGRLCQNVFVNFAFANIFSQKVFNTIILSDKNYGLPVTIASLNFKQKSIVNVQSNKMNFSFLNFKCNKANKF